MCDSVFPYVCGCNFVCMRLFVFVCMLVCVTVCMCVCVFFVCVFDCVRVFA